MNSLFVPIVGYNETVKLEGLLKEKYHLSDSSLSELAGLHTAFLSRELLQGKKNVLVLAGAVKNGVDALIATKHLLSTGQNVCVFLAEEPTTPLGVLQKTILQSMNVSFLTYQQVDGALQQSDLVIDGLVGYDLHGNPKGMVELLIGLVNLRQKPVLSIDVPTGYELKTGLLRQPHMKATATLCLGLVKEGLDEEFAGTIYVANIGIPPQAYETLGLEFEHERFEGVVQAVRKE